jgi:hypothetical protein
MDAPRGRVVHDPHRKARGQRGKNGLNGIRSCVCAKQYGRLIAFKDERGVPRRILDSGPVEALDLRPRVTAVNPFRDGAKPKAGKIRLKLLDVRVAVPNGIWPPPSAILRMGPAALDVEERRRPGCSALDKDTLNP